MSYTKSQVSNFLDDKILFRFGISSDYTIKFDANEELFTFEELERIIKSNYDYWNSVYESSSTNFRSTWKSLNDRFNTVKNYIFESEELNIDIINNQIYSNLSSNWQTMEQDKKVYTIFVESPIDIDTQFHKIRRFVSFYIKYSEHDLDKAVKNFIYLYHNNNAIGSFLAENYHFMFYPALYLLRKTFQILKIM